VASPSFDKFAHVPETPCECGKCGLTFRRVMGQKQRRWAVGCPTKAEELRQKSLRDSAKHWEKRKAGKLAKKNATRDDMSRKAVDAIDNRPRTKMCKVCCNLAHARPVGGVCSGGMVTTGDKNVRAWHDGCGLPWEGTPSLRNHDMLTRMPENTERAPDGWEESRPKRDWSGPRANR
jgi:hypothetical protein